MTLDELRALSEPLARFVGAGKFHAAFSGPGGIYAVYGAPALMANDPFAAMDPPRMATIRNRVLLVEVEDLGWINVRVASGVAEALAAGTIEAKPGGAGLVVAESDVDRFANL